LRERTSDSESPTDPVRHPRLLHTFPIAARLCCPRVLSRLVRRSWCSPAPPRRGWWPRLAFHGSIGGSLKVFVACFVGETACMAVSSVTGGYTDAMPSP
jgi:hypothetical protein